MVQIESARMRKRRENGERKVRYEKFSAEYMRAIPQDPITAIIMGISSAIYFGIKYRLDHMPRRRNKNVTVFPRGYTPRGEIIDANI